VKDKGKNRVNACISLEEILSRDSSCNDILYLVFIGIKRTKDVSVSGSQNAYAYPKWKDKGENRGNAFFLA